MTYYYWDEVNDNLFGEEDENGEVSASYTHEPGLYGELIAQERDGETRYYNYDGLGNTSELTDENQNVTDTYEYSAFGEEVARTGTTENPFGYKGSLGYYTNGATNDIYVRARMYEPRIARWLSQDPIGGVNLYTYCMNTPSRFIDPSGESQDDCAGTWASIFNPCYRRKTQLVYMAPTGGATSTDIEAQIHPCPGAENIKFGCCGAFSWSVQFRAKGRFNGFIIQHVNVKFEIEDCKGGDITAEVLAQNGFPMDKYANNGFEFWEAFVLLGGATSQNCDTYSMSEFASGRCTKGKVDIRASYGLVKGKIPQPPMWFWVAAPFTDLHSSWVDPNVKTFVPMRKHDLVVKWNCCECMPMSLGEMI